MPDRTRWRRLLATQREWADRFLRAPTFFTLTDSYSIKLIHPMREGRSAQQIGKKGICLAGLRLRLEQGETNERGSLFHH